MYVFLYPLLTVFGAVVRYGVLEDRNVRSIYLFRLLTRAKKLIGSMTIPLFYDYLHVTRIYVNLLLCNILMALGTVQVHIDLCCLV